MSYQYTFIVSETEPTNLQPGTFWLHNSSGVLQFKLSSWAQLNNGGSGLSIVDGTYTRNLTAQTSAPGAPDIGDIWLDDNNAVRIYLSTWTELVSGFAGGTVGGGGELSILSEDLENMTISHGQVAIKLSQAQAFWYLGGNFVPFAGDFNFEALNGAVTVYINGIFRNLSVQTKSLKIVNSINERVDTCAFKYYMNGTNDIETGSRIDVYDSKNVIKIFGGQITKITQDDYFPSSTMLTYTATCTSWEKRLQSKIIAEAYEDKTAGYIIKNLIDLYLPEFSYVNVEDGLTIESITFNYITLQACIKKIAKETGYNWYIDYDKDIHFFQDSSNVSPFTLTDTSNNFNKFKISYDKSQIRNKILIKGGYYLEQFNTDIQVADGEQTNFVTAYVPYDPVAVYVDTGGGFVQKTLGIKNINDSGFDFVLDQNEKTVENLDIAKLSSGDIIKITYKRKVPFFSQGEDTDSIDNLKTIEGGDGIYEYTIKDDNIVTVDAANQRITAELNDYANPKIKGSFTTYNYGLRSGQLLSINLSNFSLDVSYMIQKVTLSIFIDDDDPNNTVLKYTVSFMTLLKGLQEFLLNMYNSGREIVVGENEIINTFRQVGDTVSITDSVSSSTHSATYLWDDASTTWDFFQWS